MLFLQENPQGIIFKVFVQPKSSKNTIAGLYGDALKIKLTAPPIDGAANKMCIKFLAKCLKVPKTSLEIISGHTSRTKYVLYKQKHNNKDRREDVERFKKEFEQLLNAKKQLDNLS
ncbi:MAG: YggU family protein [Proteobacteria bacterium]|nr:YggU family protein [Desulfobacteraceae bacterium]MBU3980474.1 YggU family protein [Pseudomonadota bacterium]MBU4013484.1 YggU family protein [Pseudomonadota bacterium]MBU4067899.1 YggU family protein [Pseudomonadota bacterium]MBU4101041.1 YggU family protein [Pseudomonadota bacterium]